MFVNLDFGALSRDKESVKMHIRPIRNDADHREALQDIEILRGAPVGSPEGDKLDVLATLVSDDEDRRWPIDPGSPRDLPHHAVDTMGRTQKDLADLPGSRSRASDLLIGRRRVLLAAAQKIGVGWSIPIQLLVAPYENPEAA